MRSYEMRMEEIYRRSEKIRKKRRKLGKCVCACCVPAVLFLGICFAAPRFEKGWGSVTVPAGQPGGEISAGGAIADSILAGGSIAPVSVQLDLEGESRSIQKEADVLAIFAVLQEAAKEKKKEYFHSGTRGEDNGESDADFSGNQNALIPDCTVLVEMSDGSVLEYRLFGDMLICSETAIAFRVRQELLEELSELLGIK